jgi:ornithine cyclodeaminase/alanine dehydrogenase-like protein (mu-crystallin family)
MHLRALIQRFPLEHISLVDIRIDTAEAVVARLREDLEVDLDVVAIESRKAAVQEADIILTVTTGDMPLIERSWLRQGAFVARLGSYQEVALDVITEADKLIVDRWEYVRDRVPELRQLIERKLLGRDDIHAEWPAIACGRAMGRESTSEIIVFIALGTWGEYAAILPAIYQRAVEMKLGVEVGG